MESWTDAPKSTVAATPKMLTKEILRKHYIIRCSIFFKVLFLDFVFIRV